MRAACLINVSVANDGNHLCVIWAGKEYIQEYCCFRISRTLENQDWMPQQEKSLQYFFRIDPMKISLLPGMEDSQVALVVKNLTAKAGDGRHPGLIPGSGRSPEEGNGNPCRYSCLENPKDKAVHRVAKSRTWLKWLCTGTPRHGTLQARIL